MLISWRGHLGEEAELGGLLVLGQPVTALGDRGKPAPWAQREAATGIAGLSAALSDHPDLVLMDLALPGLTGEDVLQHLKRQRPGQAVLVWSATADPDAEARCLTLGAHDYLHKPLPTEEVLWCIRAHLSCARD